MKIWNTVFKWHLLWFRQDFFFNAYTISQTCFITVKVPSDNMADGGSNGELATGMVYMGAGGVFGSCCRWNWIVLLLGCFICLLIEDCLCWFSTRAFMNLDYREEYDFWTDYVHGVYQRITKKKSISLHFSMHLALNEERNKACMHKMHLCWKHVFYSKIWHFLSILLTSPHILKYKCCMLAFISLFWLWSYPAKLQILLSLIIWHLIIVNLL